MKARSYINGFETLTAEVTCPHCSGSGEGCQEGWACRSCKGTGVMVLLTDHEPGDDGDAKYDQWNEEERG